MLVIFVIIGPGNGLVSLIQHVLTSLNPCVAEYRIFLDDYANAKAADALAPCTAGLSAIVKLIV